MKNAIKTFLGPYHMARLRHVKRQLEVKHFNKGEPELAILPQIIDKSRVSLDVGANIGDYLTVLAANSRRTLAFEPHPVCFKHLTAIGLKNCTLVNLALSDAAGTATLKVPLDGQEISGLATIEAENTLPEADASSLRHYEVRTARLDDIIDDHLQADESIGFIKIDVEGHEYAVLCGALATIDRHRPIIMVEIEYRHSSHVEDIFAMFAQRDYVAGAFIRSKFSPIDASALADLQRGIGIDNIVEDAKDSIYVNNVWFIPPEQANLLEHLG